MIDASRFIDRLQGNGVRLFTGVPDSLLKALNAEILHRVQREDHVIGANEGSCVALAIGHYLRTGQPALVYMQNSGFGNAVNPLLSLADNEVYGVPMVLVVGWRGRPGVKDEPQHVKQGRVMPQLLDALELPWSVLPDDPDEADRAVDEAVRRAHERSAPFVLLVEKETFGSSDDTVGPTTGPRGDEELSREAALEAVVSCLGEETINVSTTGMLSRELFELRRDRGDGGDRDFLTVGGMGHASTIAFGIALRERAREVWILDGDGALLMHLGALAVIADHAPTNLFHVVFNNGVHDSVGGQPTSASVVDTPAVVRGLGYRWAESTADGSQISDLVSTMRDAGGPALLEVRVRPGNRPGIGRPTRTPAEGLNAFTSAIRNDGI
jgi:phosphonopyruvate decarboxylase